MTRRGVAAMMAAGLVLAGCAEGGGVPIYAGDTLLTTIGGPAGVGATAGAPAASGARPQGLAVGNIFSSEGLPIHIGGRRINCPDGQSDC